MELDSSNAAGVQPPPTSLRLRLEVPPSANRYWRLWRGHIVRSPLAEAYANGALVRAKNARLHPFPRKAAIALRIDWFREMRAGDLDNRLKVLLDALQGLLYHSDGQIAELHAYRWDGSATPRVEVAAWRLRQRRADDERTASTR